jgi:hypothetical protein
LTHILGGRIGDFVIEKRLSSRAQSRNLQLPLFESPSLQNF